MKAHSRQLVCQLRGIAEDTSLGLRTVRTILDQQVGADRTSIKHLERIDPDRARERIWQAKRRMRELVSCRIAPWRRPTPELRKEVKELDRSR